VTVDRERSPSESPLLNGMARLENPVEIDSLDALAHLVLTADGPLYVRVLSGLEQDGADGSIDHESGLPDDDGSAPWQSA
jgi:hypothetical protein